MALQHVADQLADPAVTDDDDAPRLVAGRREAGEIGIVGRRARGDPRGERRERGNGHHRQGHRHHQMRADLRPHEPLRDARADQGEREFAAGTEQQRDLARHGETQPQRQRQHENDRGLDRDQSERKAEREQRPGDDRADVQAGADRHEEQAEQQALERLDRHLDLAPVFGFGQQQSGDECAERHRQAGHRRHDRRAHDDQQARGHEEFRRMRLGDLMEQRPQQQPAGADDERQRGRRRQDGEQQSLAQAAAQALAAHAEHRHHEQHGRDHQVLRQQHGESGAAGRLFRAGDVRPASE